MFVYIEMSARNTRIYRHEGSRGRVVRASSVVNAFLLRPRELSFSPYISSPMFLENIRGHRRQLISGTFMIFLLMHTTYDPNCVSRSAIAARRQVLKKTKRSASPTALVL